MLSAPFKPPRFINNKSDESTPKKVPKHLKRVMAPKPAPKQVESAKKHVNTPNSGIKKYIVQYRKQSNKKHKTWEGDGQLVVKDGSMIFRFENRNITKPMMALDGIMKFGGYEVEIDCEIEGEPDVQDGVEEDVDEDIEEESIPEDIEQESVSETSMEKNSLGKRLGTGNISTNETNEVQYIQEKPLKILKPDPSIFTLNTNPPVIVDPHLTKILRPHQRDGVKFLYDGIISNSGVLLADEMGLGKTLMTITTIWTLLKQSPDPQVKSHLNNIIIICPVTLISNWKREFKKWLDMNKLGVLVIDKDTANFKQDLRNFSKSKVYQVLIMSYEKLLNCEAELSQIHFDLLVCDEGHKLKNSQNKTLKVLKNLDIDNKILISGTPIQNNLNEFYTLVNFLNPGALGSFSQFQSKFIKPIEYSRDVNCLNKEILARGHEASQELMEITGKFILRRTSEVLSKYLGPKTDMILFVKPSNLQVKLFNEVLSKVGYSTENALTLINTFKKICNCPTLLENDTLYKSTGMDMDLTMNSGKINLLIAMINEIHKRGEKLVLISNYTKTLDLFSTICSKLNYSFLRLDGTTNSSTRSTIINQFNNTPFPQYPIFLLSSKSGGFGINLIGGSRLILFDNDWNPATDLQAMSRIYRDGQTKPVYIYRLITSGCMDEKILQRQLMKSNLSDWFLDLGEVNSNVFDMEDLKDLFTVNDTDCNTHDLLGCSCGDGVQEVQKDVDTEPPSDITIPSSQYSDGWMSALDFQQPKKSINSALADYKHFSDLKGFEHDEVVKNVKGLSFVFSRHTEPGNT